MALPVNKLDKYISDTKQETGVIKLDYYNDNDEIEFTISLKTDISISEKAQFIEEVIANTYIDPVVPNYLGSEVSFALAFLQYFTDIPLPTKIIETEDGDEQVIDTQAAFDYVHVLNLIPRYENEVSNVLDNLRSNIDQRIEFENRKILSLYRDAHNGDSRSTEAIEDFITLVHKGYDVMDAVLEFIKKNGSKLSKIISSKKIATLLEKLIETVAEKAPEVSAESGQVNLLADAFATRLRNSFEKKETNDD